MALDDFGGNTEDKSSNDSEASNADKQLAEQFEDYEDIVELVEGTILRWSEGQSITPVMYDKENNTVTALKDHLVVGIAALIIKVNEEHQEVFGTSDSDDNSEDSTFDLSDLDDR